MRWRRLESKASERVEVPRNSFSRWAKKMWLFHHCRKSVSSVTNRCLGTTKGYCQWSDSGSAIGGSNPSCTIVVGESSTLHCKWVEWWKLIFPYWRKHAVLHLFTASGNKTTILFLILFRKFFKQWLRSQFRRMLPDCRMQRHTEDSHYY